MKGEIRVRTEKLMEVSKKELDKTLIERLLESLKQDSSTYCINEEILEGVSWTSFTFWDDKK